MLRTVDISQYWRNAVKESEEFKEIAAAENPEFYLVWQAFERVLNNQFLDTMDDFGLGKWEKFLKITPLATDTFGDRRFRIKALLMGDLPYTMRSLINKLNNICGQGNVQVNYIKSDFLLEIKIALEAKEQKAAVGVLLKRILPANIILSLDLLYNKHETLADFRHSELKRYTHNELRSEVLQHNAEVGFGLKGTVNYGESVESSTVGAVNYEGSVDNSTMGAVNYGGSVENITVGDVEEG